MGFKMKGHTEFSKAEHIVEYKKGQPLRTSGRKSGRQPAESLEASLKWSLCRFCVSDGRRKGSHWDTSTENKGDKRDSKGLQI
ncbi:hypothetical protein SLEP1_g59265 [Rubroshorea leprosula]|uniref:HNH homing endonuclease n=1 Tax=Rubroshorea leprosula TaxID=152421 RepID=A0AAV5MUM5_9ROSI|nr:hypothetical protein SLEP1_g59265 [Rubroshorea leprosula]